MELETMHITVLRDLMHGEFRRSKIACCRMDCVVSPQNAGGFQLLCSPDVRGLAKRVGIGMRGRT